MTATYIGNGDWIPGVPARDLSEEEYAKHKDAISENEAATRRALYVKAEVEEEDAKEERAIRVPPADDN